MEWCSMDISDTSRKYYSGFDWMRIVLSLLVLTIHIPVENEWFTTYIQNGIARIAVPMFFAMSSFLFFIKEKTAADSKLRLKQYCFKMIRLYGTWTAILVLGGREHLWYLWASAIGMLIVFFLTENMSESHSFFVVGLLYFLGCLVETYGKCFQKIHLGILQSVIISSYRLFLGGTMRNGIFFAPIYIYLGRLFAYQKASWSKTLCMFLFGGAVILFYLEVFFVQSTHLVSKCDFYFMLPALTAILFYIVAHIKTVPVKHGRVVAHYTFLFYVLQLFSRWVYEYVLCRISIIRDIPWAFTEYLFAVVMTCFMSGIILKVSKQKGFSVMKYLYM